MTRIVAFVMFNVGAIILLADIAFGMGDHVANVQAATTMFAFSAALSGIIRTHKE